MEKNEFRAVAVKKKKMLEESYRTEADRGIALRLLQHPVFLQAESIFIYVSLPEEPDTAVIIDTAWQMGKAVFVPRCLPGKEHIMEAVRIHDRSDLVSGRYGIPEPEITLPAENGGCFDMGIIPCVAADVHGGRLGHGAGYYDRFLEQTPMDTWCLCYEKMIMEEIPMDPTDIMMQHVVTEDRVIRAAGRGEASEKTEKQGFIKLLSKWFK